MQPYIGVTGFTRREEVSAALACLPDQPTRQLMVGVLASWKSLREIPLNPRWQAQTPNIREIIRIFPSDPQVLNLVHYSSEEGQEELLLPNLLRIHVAGGVNCHGLQLNLAWPKVRVLEVYREVYRDAISPQRIVLQVGNRAIAEAGGTPQGVADKLADYAGVIDAILLDSSGGKGEPLDPKQAHEFLYEIAQRNLPIGLGVAGGLGPNTFDLVVPLLKDFPNVNIDAQGQLRSADNELDLTATRQYLTQAFALLQ